MSLGMDFEVSKAHFRPRLSISRLFMHQDVNSQLLLRHHACSPAAMLPAMMVMGSHSEAVTTPQLNVFFYKLPWSWCLCTAAEQ